MGVEGAGVERFEDRALASSRAFRLRDIFNRRRKLQLGVENGETSPSWSIEAGGEVRVREML